MIKWKTIESNVVYDSRYMKIRKDVVELPNKERKGWTYWDSTDSVMVIGMIGKKMIMVRQYRYLVGGETLELPAGHLNEDESVEDGAKREFAEETGYVIKSPLIKLGAFYETSNQLNRKIHLFYGEHVEKSEDVIISDDDIPEEIEVVFVDFNEAIKYAIDNEVVDTSVALALFLFKEKVELGNPKNSSSTASHP